MKLAEPTRARWFGHAPTGGVVTLTGISIFRLADGRIAERWAEHGLGVQEQLAIAAPAQPAGAHAERREP